MKNVPREMLCLTRLVGGWCVLLADHDGPCRSYPRMPLPVQTDAIGLLDRCYPKGSR
jgi:hypothetical protein